VQFIDLQAQRLRMGSAVEDAILKVVRSGHYILGPEIALLEKQLASFCGAKHALTVANGTDALALALMALGIKPRQAVFVPSFTFAATGEVVVWLGATPIFIDCLPDTFNMDPASLEAGIATAKRLGLEPVGVIPVDLFGLPADYDAIEPICAAHNLWMLTDTAQGFGGVYKDRKTGAIGHIASTSFFPAKPLGCYGDGGAVFFDDDKFLEPLVSMRVHGQGSDKYDNVRIGMNGRMDTIQAAVLIEKLKLFPGEIVARNRIAQRYSDALENRCVVPRVPAGLTSVWAQYTIRINGGRRDAVAAALKADGIPTAIYYVKPMHRQTAYRHFPVANNGLPVSDRLAGEVLSLPMHPYLSIFLDHPIIVRHFVDSGVFREIVSKHDVLFVAPPGDHKRIKGADLSRIPAEKLVRIDECHPRSLIWMRIFQIEMLRDRRSGQSRALSEHHRHSIGFKAFVLYSILGLPGIWQIYRRILMAKLGSLKNRPLEDLIDREKPDMILHPSVLAGVYINDLIDVARARGIPVVGIMNSWDNPSTKRAVVGHLDWLLVWGQQTKDHAIRYMEMAPERVVCFGAAQFDVYREKPRRTPDQTRAVYALSPGTRLLLYAGSSKGSDEFKHLEYLEAAIENGELPNLVVVYRPHPWGDCGKDGGRIAAKAWRHVRFDMAMVPYITAAQNGSQPITTPDYRDTQDILGATDILVSPISTILLESALHGIPNVCLIDDADEDDWYLDVNTRLEHLREYFEVEDPDSPARIRKAADYFVDSFQEPYGERLCLFIEHLMAERGASVDRSTFGESPREPSAIATKSRV